MCNAANCCFHNLDVFLVPFQGAIVLAFPSGFIIFYTLYVTVEELPEHSVQIRCKANISFETDLTFVARDLVWGQLLKQMKVFSI